MALGSFTSLDRAEKFKTKIQTELSKSAPRPAASVILRDFTTASGRNIKRVLVAPSSKTPDARSLVSYFKTHGYPDAWFLAGNFGNPVGTSKSTTRVATANPLRPTTEVERKPKSIEVPEEAVRIESEVSSPMLDHMEPETAKQTLLGTQDSIPFHRITIPNRSHEAAGILLDGKVDEPVWASVNHFDINAIGMARG